jgi:hypothetical protein
MAYKRKYEFRHRARLQARRAAEAQDQDLAAKTGVKAAMAIGLRIGANYSCTRPEPDHALCYALNNAAIKQAKELEPLLLQCALRMGIELLSELFRK